MSAIGKGSLSLRKRDISNSRSASTGFVKVVFAHKATGGESSISLTSLVAPSEMLANGFVQPSSSLLSDLNIYNYRQNLTLRSSVRGELWDYLSYSVASNSVINFLGFTLLPNEVIEGIIDNAPRDGLMVVDGQSIVSTGTLAAGQTDFNVNGPFETNKYPTQQAGAVLVYRDGVIQARCDGNSLLNAGNYIEVPVTGGFGTLIRFKVAAGTGGANIMVLSNGVAFERPAVSTLASIEKLGGQIDKVVQVLSDAAGVPTTTFQSAPNSVDLATFGNQVLQNTSDIAALQVQAPFLSQVSNTYTPITSARYYPLVNSGLTLTPGSWMVFGTVLFQASGGNPQYTNTYALWTSSQPVSETIGQQSAFPLEAGGIYTIAPIFPASNETLVPTTTVRVTVTVPTTIYLNVKADMTTPSFARISTNIWAQRVK